MKKTENKDIIDYQSALLKEKSVEVDSLTSEIKSLKNEIENINKSLSFKIGLLITSPLRLIANLFKKKKKRSNLFSTCDHALIYNNQLEVTGWALADVPIKSIEIFNNIKSLGFAKLRLHRGDVLKAFPDNPHSYLSGFKFKCQLESSSSIISINVKDEKNNTVRLKKVIIPSIIGMSYDNQYQILLKQQDKKVKLDEFNFKQKPLISLVLPTYNVASNWLDFCINSIQNQTYSNWQLCIYDDASTSTDTLSSLNAWVKKDQRIHIEFGKNNLGISLATNEAIKMVKGDFIGLMDHDDELTSDALYEIIKCINNNPEVDFIYSDEDKIEADGSLTDPHFKSDFNLDAFLCQNYICHFSVIRKSLGDQVGWFRSGFEGSQDYDLFLRIASLTKKIHHIPKVLYHWRKIEGSTSIAIDNKNYAVNAGKRALESYLSANKIKATVENGLFINSFRVKHDLLENKLISIIIPFRDQAGLLKTCVESILNNTNYQNYELLLVDNQSKDLNVIKYGKELSKKHTNIKLLYFDEEFNYSKINNYAVKQSKGEHVLFLNNDIEIINEDWLTSMIEPIQRHEVAAVGAKLLFADQTIQHAGMVVDKNSAVHINKGLMDTENGYFERANYIQNVSACTAACLLVKKEVFLEVGGFDEELFKIAYNDVDLCLKMRQAGYLITYTPYAKLYHYESKSRGLDTSPEKLERFTNELRNYQQKWGETYKDGDPYFNPNLLPTSEKIMLNIK